MSNRLLLGAGSESVAPPPPPPPSGGTLSVFIANPWHTGASPTIGPQAAKDIGCVGIRSSFFWPDIEAVNGVYAIPANYKGKIVNDKCVEIGMQHTVPCSGSNSGLHPPNYPPLSQGWINGYKGFVKFLADQLNGKIQVIEIWNEWIGGVNNGWGCGAFAAGICGDSTTHANLVAQSYDAIRLVNSNVKVLPSSTTGTSGENLPWMKNILTINKLDKMDGLNIHSYDLNKFGENFTVTAARLDTFQNECKAITGTAEVPFYLTESGLKVGPAFPTRTEQDKADHHSNVILLCTARPYMKMYSVWVSFASNVTDHAIWSTGDMTGPKAAVAAIKDANVFAGHTFVAKQSSPANVWLHKYLATGNKNRYALWSPLGTPTSTKLSFTASAGGTLVTRAFGGTVTNSFAFSAGSNNITIPISPTPKEITGVDSINVVAIPP